jgi:hypothetical protein
MEMAYNNNSIQPATVSDSSTRGLFIGSRVLKNTTGNTECTETDVQYWLKPTQQHFAGEATLCQTTF